MNRGYDALAADWQEQADRYVREAQSSSTLRDIVRLIAMASTLEHAARKVTSGSDVNLEDIVRIISLASVPGASRSGSSIAKRSANHVDSFEATG